MAWGERAEHTMGGLGIVAAASFAAGWNREAARQAAVAAQVARNAEAAANAIADTNRAECDKLRRQLIAARIDVARLQTRVDALEAEDAGEDCVTVRLPAATTETGEVALRTALIYAIAEAGGLHEEIDDLEDDLAA